MTDLSIDIRFITAGGYPTLEALNDKMDRDGGNSTAGIDSVVEWQLPTANNNYTWYRKYKSGWVEQGGITNYMSWTGNGASITVTLPIPMSNNNFVTIRHIQVKKIKFLFRFPNIFR